MPRVIHVDSMPAQTGVEWRNSGSLHVDSSPNYHLTPFCSTHGIIAQPLVCGYKKMDTLWRKVNHGTGNGAVFREKSLL